MSIDLAEDFRPSSLPPDGEKIARGVFRSINSKNQPVLWVLFNADPSRNADWEASGRRNAYSESAWRREQWIDFQAGGGELVLRSLLEARWNEIIITDPAQLPLDEMRFGAGLDYGKTHFATFVANGVDRKGCKYSVLEHGAKELTPETHVKLIKQRRLPRFKDGTCPYVLDKVTATYYDPKLNAGTASTGEVFTSQVSQFKGFPHLISGIRGLDLKLLDFILEAWHQTPVKYRIYCPRQISNRTATSPQWEGCPNLVWELLNLRRREYSAVREQSVGSAEGLVDKDNDFWDALKYWWTSEPSVPVITKEEKWEMRATELKEKNPTMDLNSLIMYANQFNKENKQKEPSWR